MVCDGGGLARKFIFDPVSAAGAVSARAAGTDRPKPTLGRDQTN